MCRSDTQIVVVDDEQYICSIIEESLSFDDYNIRTFSDPAKAIDFIENNHVDLVLTDLMMAEYTGVQVLECTREHHDDAVVMMMTAHPTVQTAISVLKKGAYDFLVKPFKLEVLRATIKRGLNHQKVVRENLQLKSQVKFLKVANSYGVGSDIDDYLKLVLNSCRTEFNAVAAGLIQIDPDNGGDVIRWFSESKDDDFDCEVLDETHLDRFNYTRSNQPYINTEEVEIDGQPMLKTLIAKPVFVRRTLHGVINLLILDKFRRVTPGELDVLSILTNSAASAMENAGLYEDLQHSYLEAINALAHAIEARDQCTKGHTDRVAMIADLVAAELGWDAKRRADLAMGCTLHDIGKLGVPDSILNKPGLLTERERRIMETHPEVGLKIVRGIDLLKPAIPYIIAHHERYDGDGYPGGLQGEEVPIEGRLLAVVDTFDAILSDRPYRDGASLQIALSEIWNNRGTQFDPVIVDTFFKLIREGKVNFEKLYDRVEDLCVVEEITATEMVPA